MSTSNQGGDPIGAKGDKGTFGEMMSSLSTPGVKNIEAAYTRAGATPHHTPGAASKLGSQDTTGGSAHQGVGSEQFSNNISDQRQEPSAIGKMFNNLINGTDNTK